MKKTESLYLTYLMACGLRDLTPKEPPARINWQNLYELAGWNSITGLTWHAAQRCSSLPENVRVAWRQSAFDTELRRIMYDAEREEITKALLNSGISVLPLKGASIASLYPAADMRSMADNDMLYGYLELDDMASWHIKGRNSDEQRHSMITARDSLTRIMAELGYKPDGSEAFDIDKWHEVSFNKKPFFKFEMHHSLIGRKGLDKNFFSNPWQFAIGNRSENGKGLTLSFPKEIEYIYIVIHAYKHATRSSAGIRFLADTQVYLDAWSPAMNWTMILSILEKLGIDQFEKQLRNLTSKVFSHETLTHNEQALLHRMVIGGTFGSETNALEMKLNRYGEKYRHPRLRVVMDTLTPSPTQNDSFLKLIADNPKTRPLFPVIKSMWLAVGLARHPRIYLSKLRAFFQGRSAREGLGNH